MHFSVSMCVYGKDNPVHFGEALSSVINQTAPPDEIVLVVDGPIPDVLQQVIDEKKTMFRNLNVTYLEKNVGHGEARRIGISKCQHPLVAIMDADDVAVDNRFEVQLGHFASDEALSIVGGNISEFIDKTDNVVGIREVPQEHDDIIAYMKSRCPMNQMTVMFKKEDVQKSGGYIDWYCDEDYYLWIRMMQNGCRFKNTGTVLVNARVGEEMYKRRGGYKYFKSEARLQKYMLDNKIISAGKFLYNVLIRFVLQVMMPNSIRGWVFKVFARK